MRILWGRRLEPLYHPFSRRPPPKKSNQVIVHDDNPMLESSSSDEMKQEKQPKGVGGEGGGGRGGGEESPGNATVPLAHDECAIVVSEENPDEQFFSIGPKRLFSLSSISISPDELRCLSINEEKSVEFPIREVHHYDSEGETPISRARSSKVEGSSQEKPETSSPRTSSQNAETSSNEKYEFHLNWFLKKIKKGSAAGLNSFNPTLLPSLKKSSAKKPSKSSGNETESVPVIPPPPPQVETNLFYGFESSWKNFSLSDLKAATNNFSEENLIAEGGFSTVYKGILDYGQLVAIKKLRGSQEEMTSDYLSELGILVHVKHPNIANVIGYGVEDGMHLVLPLSPYGSLESMLKGQKDELSWSCRYKIALGAASGLAYLHEYCQRRVIHRDIKSANILLTEDFEAQICDFGLAKWLPEHWTHLTVSQYEGTFGYLPPEYFLQGVVDEKTDVYSYGVVLLEIITGRPAIDDSHNSVVMWAKPLLINKDIDKLVDPSLLNTYDSEQLKRMVMVASLCIHQTPSERPQMSTVATMLQGNRISMNKGKFQRRPPVLKRSSSYAIKINE